MSPTPTADALVSALLAPVRDVPDPVDRARLVGELLTAVPGLQAGLAEIRHQAVQQLRDDDVSFAAIGEALGVSKTRAAQLAKGITTKGRGAPTE